MSSPPIPAQTPAVVPPFFLRQLRRGNAWGQEATAPEVRVNEVLKLAFEISDPAQSLFLVTSADDFRRVIVGMRANCDEPTKGPFRFVGFTPAELAAVGIDPTHVTEDLTGCYIANRQLHHDARTDEAALRQLCLNAFAAGRMAVDVRRKELEAMYSTANAEGCPACPSLSRPTPQPCHVAACLALPAPAPAAAPEGA
jgi:hypothetical protein